MFKDKILDDAINYSLVQVDLQLAIKIVDKTLWEKSRR